MKKVFLFLAVSALTFSSVSCEKDENTAAAGSMGTVKCTVEGTQKTFSQVIAQNSILGVQVTAFNGTTQATATESITFVVEPDETGTGAMADMGFNYLISGDMYTDGSSFALNVTENNTTAKTLKGTFSGTLNESMGAKPSKAVTNGTFDIKY